MKLTLTIILSGRAYNELEFEDFDKLRLGRSEDCEVWIDNLGISRFHAEILNKDDYLLLRDLGSHNGTQLNGVSVQNHGLNTGDVIKIGKFTIDVQVEGRRRAGTGRIELAKGDLTISSNPAALVKAQEEGAIRLRGYLAFDEATAQESTVPLDTSYLLIGKDDVASIKLQGMFAPRLGAVIVREDQGFKALDLSPKGNALEINGDSRREARLNDGDEVKIREISFRFRHGRQRDE